MDGTEGSSTENIGKYAIIGAAVVGVILYFALTISFSVTCFLCRKRPNRQENEVRSQGSTVEPVRQPTHIHTLSSTVMDSNDRIVLVYQSSSGSDTVFAMDIPQSSDLGSVYEEEASIDSSNTSTPDLPPRTEEMYLTTDGFPCFSQSQSPSPLPPPLHPLDCSGEDTDHQVDEDVPTTQPVWHSNPLEHTPPSHQSPPAMDNAHTVKTTCPLTPEETGPPTFLHREALQMSDYENIVPPSAVQPFSPMNTTLTSEHISQSQQAAVPAMNNAHTLKTTCKQPPLTPVHNEETSPPAFLHKEPPNKANYENIAPPSLPQAVQPSPPINLTHEHIPLSQQQSAPAVTYAHAKPHLHSPCQQPPLTPVINGPPPFLPTEPSHIHHYENTVPSSLPPLRTPNLPFSHHTVIELPPRHIRRYPLPSSGGGGESDEHKHDVFLKYNESYHSLMKHFHIF